MAETSKIQWTDATWNIARGCTKVDEDCKYCYMYRDGNRYGYDPMDIVRTKSVFTLPLKLKEPSRIFTSSLTDFFHEAIDSYRDEAWDIIRRCPQHTFQILTKRPERILANLPVDWGEGWDNVWLGTSAGSSGEKAIRRINDLTHIKAIGKVKTIFLSLEPLHGPIDLWLWVRTKIIDWVIVGGESGNETGKYRYRPCELEWLRSIVHDCQTSDTPVFVKQMGTHLSKVLQLKDRHGGNIEEFPCSLQIRQFPVSISDH